MALSATSFGAMAIFARVAYAGGADVTAVLFLRFAIASVAMAALTLATRRRWPSRRNATVLALMGGVGYVAQSMCFFSALRFASAGLVALLLYLYPFLVALIGVAFLGERLTRRRSLAMAASMITFRSAASLEGVVGEVVDIFSAFRLFELGIFLGGPVGIDLCDCGLNPVRVKVCAADTNRVIDDVGVFTIDGANILFRATFDVAVQDDHAGQTVRKDIFHEAATHIQQNRGGLWGGQLVLRLCATEKALAQQVVERIRIHAQGRDAGDHFLEPLLQLILH